MQTFFQTPRNDIFVPTGCPKVSQNDRIHFFLSFFLALVPDVVLNRSGNHDFFMIWAVPFQPSALASIFHRLLAKLGPRNQHFAVHF